MEPWQATDLPFTPSTSLSKPEIEFGGIGNKSQQDAVLHATPAIKYIRAFTSSCYLPEAGGSVNSIDPPDEYWGATLVTVWNNLNDVPSGVGRLVLAQRLKDHAQVALYDDDLISAAKTLEVAALIQLQPMMDFPQISAWHSALVYGNSALDKRRKNIAETLLLLAKARTLLGVEQRNIKHLEAAVTATDFAAALLYATEDGPYSSKSIDCTPPTGKRKRAAPKFHPYTSTYCIGNLDAFMSDIMEGMVEVLQFMGIDELKLALSEHGLRSATADSTEKELRDLLASSLIVTLSKNSYGWYKAPTTAWKWKTAANDFEISDWFSYSHLLTEVLRFMNPAFLEDVGVQCIASESGFHNLLTCKEKTEIWVDYIAIAYEGDLSSAVRDMERVEELYEDLEGLIWRLDHSLAGSVLGASGNNQLPWARRAGRIWQNSPFMQARFGPIPLATTTDGVFPNDAAQIAPIPCLDQTHMLDVIHNLSLDDVRGLSWALDTLRHVQDSYFGSPLGFWSAMCVLDPVTGMPNEEATMDAEEPPYFSADLPHLRKTLEAAARLGAGDYWFEDDVYWASTPSKYTNKRSPWETEREKPSSKHRQGDSGLTDRHIAYQREVVLRELQMVRSNSLGESKNDDPFVLAFILSCIVGIVSFSLYSRKHAILKSIWRMKKAHGSSGSSSHSARSAAASSMQARNLAEANLRECLASDSVQKLAAAIEAAENVGVEKLVLKKAKATLQSWKRRKANGHAANTQAFAAASAAAAHQKGGKSVPPVMTKPLNRSLSEGAESVAAAALLPLPRTTPLVGTDDEKDGFQEALIARKRRGHHLRSQPTDRLNVSSEAVNTSPHPIQKEEGEEETLFPDKSCDGPLSPGTPTEMSPRVQTLPPSDEIQQTTPAVLVVLPPLVVDEEEGGHDGPLDGPALLEMQVPTVREDVCLSPIPKGTMPVVLQPPIFQEELRMPPSRLSVHQKVVIEEPSSSCWPQPSPLPLSDQEQHATDTETLQRLVSGNVPGGHPAASAILAAHQRSLLLGTAADRGLDAALRVAVPPEQYYDMYYTLQQQQQQHQPQLHGIPHPQTTYRQGYSPELAAAQLALAYQKLAPPYGVHSRASEIDIPIHEDSVLTMFSSDSSAFSQAVGVSSGSFNVGPPLNPGPPNTQDLLASLQEIWGAPPSPLPQPEEYCGASQEAARGLTQVRSFALQDLGFHETSAVDMDESIEDTLLSVLE